MLRPFTAADIPAYMALYREHFTEEAAFQRTDPEEFRRVIQRGFSPLGRLALGTLRLFGRPLLDFFAYEEDGHLVGATFLFYGTGAGYISSVVVDTPYRRRGYAKALMAAAEARTRRYHRPYAVLDVLDTNTPARHLYEALRYRPIRTVGWFALDLPDGARSLPIPADADRAPGIRPLRRRDGRSLAVLARAAQPPADRAVRPISERSFVVPPALAQAFGSRSEAFVLDGPGGPRGFVRATAGGAMASGHLVTPLVAPSASPEEAERLLSAGLAFFRRYPVPRIILEAPLDDAASIRRLEARGFRHELTMLTLAKTLDAA